MDYGASGECIAGVAADLASGDENVVVLGLDRGVAECAQCRDEEVEVTLKDGFAVRVGRDIGNHQIPGVGIDTASSALAAVELHAVAPAVVEIDLVLHNLMPSEDDRRRDDPEKDLFFADTLSEILFKRQIPYEALVR